ncbi:uncharacterized protein LOC130825131 isoform X1 [Amaranthus tricolor]|uniref:uncharacterized protein LOC130825131 isoform X1 n=2 Tax=Amaranthus tricolor TaxID=29722 RepID=UPI0025888D32|nr:uncharacterized protein LOC130825131 isoform X1 [Amaranthus tricolor]
MDSEEFRNALKEFISTPETGCPWLHPFLSPPTASSVAFAWPSPRLHQPPGKDENLENINHLFNLFDMKGDGLMNINDFNVCMLIWGVQNAEFDTHGKKALNLSEFINILSSFSFKVGEPLCDIALYRLFNHHPRKEALQQAHTHMLLAEFRKNHWEKVKKLINEKKVKDYWMVFSLFDMNGDGRLTTCDFETLMLIWGLSPIDAADMLDKFDELENGTIDFSGFLTLVDLLDIQIGEPLYHFAIFTLIDYHLQVAFMPEAELLNFSAIIRRNFCGREECLLMEYNLRSSKFLFSLVDMDYDGIITETDYYVLKEIWALHDSPLDAQEEFIDFESFLQVFPSINLYAVDSRKEALNLLGFHARNGLLPPKAISHVREVLQEKRSKEAEEEGLKHHIRLTFEMNRLFSLLDYDENDHLSTKEVELLVCACKLPEDEIKGILHKVDLTWGGRINFQGLLVLLKPFTLNPFKIIESPSELFKFLDRNEDGFLSVSDFKRFALITGHQVADEDIQGLMLKLDIEGNGEVGRDHFCGAMQEYDLMPNNLELNMNKMSILNHDTTKEVADYQTEEIEFTSFWELDANVEEVHNYNSTELKWMSFVLKMKT